MKMMQQKTQSKTQSMTQQTPQSRHTVQHVHTPTVVVSVVGMDRALAALTALPLSQRRYWLNVAACDDELMQWVDAKLAVETGRHGQA
jgi:hypothetical protein